MKLLKLGISNFRGATKPVVIEFDSDKKITMIFGENGNGKSTIADAIVSLCTNSLGSIRDKSSTDKGFIKSLNCANFKDVYIKLVTDLGAYSARCNATGSSLEKTFSGTLPIVRHLRRSQIVNLIDSEPSTRYESLKDYIDVSGIIKSEDQLRKLGKSVAEELRTLTGIIDNAEKTLKKQWEEEGMPNDNYEAWAMSESQKDITEQQKSLEKLLVATNSWTETKSKKETVKTHSTKYKIAKQELEKFQNKIDELQKQNAKQNILLINLLTEARNYITGQTELNQCPLCHNTTDRKELLDSITNQIESMNTLKAAQQAQTNAANIESKAKTVLNSWVKDLMSCLAKSFDALKAIIDEKDPTQLIILEVQQKTENRDKYLLLNKNYKELDKKFLDIEAEAKKIQTTITQYNLIKQQYQSLVTNRQYIQRVKTLNEASVIALEIVETTRKQFIDDELLSISGDIESLYQKMHPDEGLGGIRLFLKPSVKNSIELNANFHSKSGITPQSLYSESHLDTLGICIFLALAKKYSTGDTILILDDVVMSVDESHLDRFIDVLHDNVQYFSHILITTHYRPWKDRYRFSRAPSHQVYFIELKPWSLENGIRIQTGKIDVEELRIALEADNFERQRIANLAGTMLENVLDFLSVRFQCKLPRKPRNDYQLKELLDCISSKLQKFLRVQHLAKDEKGNYIDDSFTKQQDLKPLIDNLKQLSAVRNQVGAHFNFDGSLVSDKDVEEFGTLTLEFAELLVCPECGSFPDRNKSGSYHETRTGSIRLHPLVEP